MDRDHILQLSRGRLDDDTACIVYCALEKMKFVNLFTSINCVVSYHYFLCFSYFLSQVYHEGDGIHFDVEEFLNMFKDKKELLRELMEHCSDIDPSTDG